MDKVKTGTYFKGRMKLYFVDAMGAMALGLFASLLIGTIFGTIAKIPDFGFFGTISSYAMSAAGMAIGVAIAYKLKMPMLVMLSSAAVGAMSYSLGASVENWAITSWASTSGSGFFSAGPAGAFFVVIIACEVGRLVSQKTKVDILVTPTVTILTGFIASWLLCPLISYIMYALGQLIAVSTTLQPILMGIIVSVVIGMVLTLPISSAAICAMIFSPSAIAAAQLAGTEEGLLLAGGAAAVGCCAQMVGFAVMSFRENRWGGLVSQGIGTSMLQMGNIVKNPRIWIPPTLAAAITGPLATTLFSLKCKGLSAGMGTCGFVGIFGIFDATNGTLNPWLMWSGIILLCLVLPAVLSVLFTGILRKVGWIKENDLKLEQ